MNNDKSKIKKIIIENEDGSTEIIDKGFLAQYLIKDNTADVTFNFVNIKSDELYAIVMSILELAGKMGFFENDKTK